MDTQELLKHRMLKFRKIGGFQEGIPIDPKRKINMKKKEGPVAGKTPVPGLKDEVEKLKRQISKAKKSSRKSSELALNKMIAKLKREVDFEFAEAVEAMGYKERFEILREEFLKEKSEDQLVHPVLMDKIEKLKNEFTQNLSAAPNFASLKYKLDMLEELSKAKNISEKNIKGVKLKQDINKKLKEVMDRPDMKEKIEALEAEVQKVGASNEGELDEETKERIVKMRKEIKMEVANVLKSMGLDVEIVSSKAKELGEQTPFLDFKSKVESLKEQTNKKIEDLINSSDLKNMIELLKLEIAKAGKKPDVATKNKIESLEQQIKQRLSAAINSSELKEKHEELKVEISEAVEFFEGSDASLKNDDSKEGSSKHHGSRVEINMGANQSFA